jgi:hypothetical protein
VPDAPVADVRCVLALTLRNLGLALVAPKIVVGRAHGWFRDAPLPHRYLVASVVGNDHQTAVGGHVDPAALRHRSEGRPPRDGPGGGQKHG